MLLITHYQRLLNYIKPDFVHIMMDGRIVASGGPELAHELEAKGYERLRDELSRQPANQHSADLTLSSRAYAEKEHTWSCQSRTSRNRRLPVRVPRRRRLRLQERARPDREVVRKISKMKDEPEWMLEFRLKALRPLRQAPDAELGRRSVRDRLRQHLLLHQADREAGQDLGRGPGVHQGHLREAGHPRGGAQVPGRRRRAVRVRGHLPLAARGPREAGRRSSSTWTPACASTRSWSSSTSARSSRPTTTSSPR